MKNVILISLALLVSCGKNTKTLVENDFDNKQNEERLDDLENRVSAVEFKIDSNIQKITSLQESLFLHSDILDSNHAETNTLLSIVQSLQVQTNNAVSQLVSLQSNDSVTSFLNPCGDNPGHYDEVLLKTNSGQVIAYFEDGGKRFLSVLEFNTNYQTTDKQSCVFQLDNNGNLK